MKTQQNVTEELIIAATTTHWSRVSAVPELECSQNDQQRPQFRAAKLNWLHQTQMTKGAVWQDHCCYDVDDGDDGGAHDGGWTSGLNVHIITMRSDHNQITGRQ